MSKRFIAGLVVASALGVADSAGAACTPMGEVFSAQGRVSVDGRPVAVGDPFCAGAAIDVDGRSRAGLRLAASGTVVRLDQDTSIKASESGNGSLLEVLRGLIHVLTREPASFEVRMPYLNAAVEGTEFVAGAPITVSEVIVIEGVVAAANDHGSIRVGAGEAASAGPGQAPARRQVVAPLDAVRWALHYPPVDPSTVAPAVREAASLLAVGRLDDARTILDMELRRDPESVAAHSLLATAAVALNDDAEAERLARRAVELDPASPLAWTALSYARQARFDLDGALAAARRAVDNDPDSAWTLARLAELQSASGDSAAALAAAERAVRADPALSRARSVLGFVHLTRFDSDAAAASFEDAIGLDPADPLARLGLGLAMIRAGDLAGGRAQLEMAASLDPDDALIRSYLGKAYFEEKRAPLDEESLALARQLDPRDPTPWFYSAIARQAGNDPVGALADLEQAIHRNDNRQVYRSRLQLDSDLAVRAISQARIYDNLGFDQLGAIAASRSLSLDPANHSAHRFLSDSAAALPRHEIARASELLQAQMLQPLNLHPQQPGLAETDLNIVTGAGPARPAYNEYTPLFVRDGTRLLLSGIGGNNGTWGDEIVVNGLHGPASFSVGQLHYESDGFRPNNDIEHDIYNLFGQAAVSPDVHVQFEYRHRRSDTGDLSLNFDPDVFAPLDRRTIETKTPRIGLHLASGPATDVLLSWIHTDREESTTNVFGPVGPVSVADLDSRADNVEAQLIHRGGHWNVVAGAGAADIDQRLVSTFDASADFPGGVCPPGPPFFGDCLVVDVIDDPVDQENAYAYLNVETGPDTVWTAGASYDSLDNPPFDDSEINPKFGVRHAVGERGELRAAYFETMRRSLLSEQTLEPTQIAGFNQLYDDFNGTRAEAAALGFDWRIGERTYAGLEYLQRDLVLPQIGLQGGIVFEDQQEDVWRGFAYTTFAGRWSLAGEVLVEEFQRDDPLAVDPLREIDTITVPVTLQYFSPTGFFAGARVTWLDQEVTSAIMPAGTLRRADDAPIVDLTAGYRLPGRRGVVSLEIRNALDEEFSYQDQDIQSAVPANPRFLPDRSIMLRVNLNL